MDIIYTLDVLSAAPSGGVPLQDLGIITNVPKWSDAPTNAILTTNYNITNLGVKHEEVQISEMLNFAITSGHIKLYGNGLEVPDNNASLVFTGNASQYVRGDGSLGNFPTSFGTGGGGVTYYLNGNIASDVVTYYEMSKIAALSPNADFSKVGDGLITQFITLIGEPNILTIPGGNWSCGIYASMSAMGGTPAIYLELLKYDGSNFTSIATSSNEVITGGTNLDLYTLTIPVLQTSLLTSDRLVIRIYAIGAAGKTTTIHTQDSHLCEISTTFSTGISAINTLTSPTQYFTTGTTGSNFGISSAGETHTFNLPVASATNTGKLSSSDWSTFNNKQSALGFTPENSANKGIANGYASLDSNSKVPSSQLPSYVDDVLEYANLAAFPVTGTSGIIYIAIDSGLIYRWSGSIYVEISTAGGGSGTVTNVSVVSANGVSGSVANSTTTPAITLTLGAITPSSVAATGTVTGSNLSGSNTGDQTITLTSDVTGSGTGSFATTIANNVVSNSKLAQVATATFKGRTTAGTGNVEDLSVSQAKTLLGLTGTNSGDQTISLTGDVTGSGTSTFATTISDDAVTFAKFQNINTNKILGRSTAASGNVEEISVGSGLTLSAGTLSATGDGTGTVTQVSVVSANGLAGTVATDTTTPAITLTTSITGVLKGNGTAISPATPGTDYVAPNVAITGATKTKITYDSKGLVTAGTDATTADIADSTNKRYVTDAQLTVLSNTSGTNTGDQTTISGNAGTATALQTARTINGVSFDGTTNITVTAAAGTLSGTTLASGVTSSSLTSVGTLTNLTVTNPISGSVTGNAATVTTNANLSGPIASVGNVTSITSQTGTGSTFVMSNSPTLVTPALGTPSSGVATNLTGTASGLTSGNVITNANLTGPVTSVGNATSVTPNAITNAMLAQVPTATFKARATAGTGDVENLTVAQTKTLLDLTGTNSGDQTITLTSDVTGSGTGSFATTIAADAVTNTKLANMATSTFKGRITAGTGDPEDLSSTQATSLLNNFVGDSGSGGTKGLVPAPGIGDATKYLKGDGTWATVAGGGSGTVTSVSVVSANGLTGTVATPTTTPAITLATSVTGVLKGNGTAISAASAGTDYVAPNAAITGSTNTKITYDSKGLVTSGTSAVLASADFANQGTTTTVLHGNASGDPSFGAVSLTTDVSGILPIANGGTNSSATLNNNRHIVSSGGALVETAAATNGQLLIGSTGAAPVLATITDGYGHSTTNGAGTITHAVSLTTTHIDGTTTLTTTSATDVALSSSITGTPAAGTYLLMFSCSMGANTNTAASTTISLYTGASLGTATQVTGTERSVKNGSGGQGASVTGSVSFQVPVTFTGTSVYEIRWRRSAGTSSIFHRQLTLLRIA